MRAIPRDFPTWNLFGSSTPQASGDDSDCLLEPVCVLGDPLRGTGNNLVLCEVKNADGSAHATNRRANLRDVPAALDAETDAWVGFEQEYTLYRDRLSRQRLPSPQGPYYCGAGVGRTFGLEFIEAHARACLDAGVQIYGLNGEVMMPWRRSNRPAVRADRFGRAT